MLGFAEQIWTSLMAAYTASTSVFDVYDMLFFGVVGYLMRRFSYSTAAFIIAFILGRGAEESLRQAMLLSSSGPLVFFEKPVSLVFLIIGLSVFLFRAITSYRRSRTHITA